MIKNICNLLGCSFICIKMKKIIYIIFCSGILISCKKKCEQEILPDTIISPTYTNEYSETMVINIKNNQKDTLINFNGRIVKDFPNHPVEIIQYDSLTYNNEEHSILFSNNYLAQSNTSVWQSYSLFTGYINYIDSSATPYCNMAGNLSLNTCSVNTGVVLNLTNIKNSDNVHVTFSPIYNNNFYGYYDEFINLNGSDSIHRTIVAPLYNFNINEDLFITIDFQKSIVINVNGFQTYFSKITSYKYISKRVQ